MQWVDSVIRELTDAVMTTGLPVNYIFVADHGMTQIDTEHPIPVPAAVDTSLFVVPRGAELLELYAKNEKDILPTYNQLKKEENGFTVYLKKDMPKHLHYGETDDVMHRIGDILLVPMWPRVFQLGSKRPDPGAHGFDHTKVKDMYAIFFAWGPAFKTAMKIPSFENVDVYPVVTRILGLSISEKIDGSDKLATKILK